MKAQPPQPPLRVLLFKEGTHWIALCIESDHCAQGDTPDEAITHCGDLLVCQLALEPNLRSPKNVKPAPQRYVRAYYKAKEQGVRQIVVERRILWSDVPDSALNPTIKYVLDVAAQQ